MRTSLSMRVKGLATAAGPHCGCTPVSTHSLQKTHQALQHALGAYVPEHLLTAWQLHRAWAAPQLDALLTSVQAERGALGAQLAAEQQAADAAREQLAACDASMASPEGALQQLLHESLIQLQHLQVV